MGKIIDPPSVIVHDQVSVNRIREESGTGKVIQDAVRSSDSIMPSRSRMTKFVSPAAHAQKQLPDLRK
jgi:hypothetical protein